MPASVRGAGLIAGAVLAATMIALPPPAGLSPEGWKVAAVGLLMAVWWMTEALPLGVTALVPLVLMPLLGIASIETTSRPYADPLVILFLGGFMLAKAIERWSLHLRLAATLLRWGGADLRLHIGGLMAATAFLSMWVSNTASAMVMLPVGQAIANGAATSPALASDRERADAATATLLSVAYAATIGGMATLIGTPPNALFAAFMRNSYGIDIGFAQWLLVGLPTAAALLVVSWLILTRWAFAVPRARPAAKTAPTPALAATIEPLSTEQKRVIAILGFAVLAWTLSPLIKRLLPSLPLSDAGIAISAALALFIVPARRSGYRPLLEWRDVAGIKWEVLILVGGGLALAQAIGTSGLAQWIGASVGALRSLPLPLLVLVVMATIVLLGELASNTAIAAIFLPISAAAAVGLGASPLTLAVPVVLAATLGFMLPVATPPNAIVYSSGLVSSRQMLRAGAILDVATTLIAAAVALTLGRWAFAQV